MKYIMYETHIGPGMVMRVGVIFSENMVHSTMDETLRAGVLKGATPVSAGFYNLETKETFGGSESMKLGSRSLDAGYLMYPQLASLAYPSNPEPYKGMCAEAPTAKPQTKRYL